MELTGQAVARRDGDRSRAHRDRNPAQGKSRRQVRRVLRAGRLDDGRRRPGDDRQHVARIRRDDGLLPRRRPDAALPAPNRPHEGRKSSSSSATRRSKACSAPTPRRCRRSRKSCGSILSTVEPSLAGPKRPQDRVPLSNMKPAWRQALTTVYGKQLPERLARRPLGRRRRPQDRAEGRRRIATPAAPSADPGFDGVPSRMERQAVSSSSTATS